MNLWQQAEKEAKQRLKDVRSGSSSSMSPIEGEEYIAGQVRAMLAELKHHKIISHVQTPQVGIVEVGPPDGSSDHRCEIMVSTYSRHMVLTGDHDTMCWGRHHHGGGVAGAIAWMGRRPGVDSYVREKASIGMGQIGVTEYNPSVALADAFWYVSEAKKDDDEDEVKFWEGVAEMVEDGDERQAIIDHIYEHDCDCERGGTLGEVPTMRLICAWCVVHKANELLNIAEAENGKD